MICSFVDIQINMHIFVLTFIIHICIIHIHTYIHMHAETPQRPHQWPLVLLNGSIKVAGCEAQWYVAKADRKLCPRNQESYLIYNSHKRKKTSVSRNKFNLRGKRQLWKTDDLTQIELKLGTISLMCGLKDSEFFSGGSVISFSHFNYWGIMSF